MIQGLNQRNEKEKKDGKMSLLLLFVKDEMKI